MVEGHTGNPVQGTETRNTATRINLKDMVSREDKHQKVNSTTVRSKGKPDGRRGAPGGVGMERAWGVVLAPEHSGGSGGAGSRHRGLGATLCTAEPGS